MLPEQLTEKKMLKCDLEDREDKSLIGKYRSLYIVTFEKAMGHFRVRHWLKEKQMNYFKIFFKRIKV